MIGLDTNVLVRFLVRDDAAQAERAKALIDDLHAAAPGFISLVVLVELIWVLRGTYAISTPDIEGVLERLLDANFFVLQEADLVRGALRSTAAATDLADALIVELRRAAGCTSTVTFDRAAARSAGMTLLR